MTPGAADLYPSFLQWGQMVFIFLQLWPSQIHVVSSLEVQAKHVALPLAECHQARGIGVEADHTLVGGHRGL